MRFRLLPLAVVIALLVAACGGSSKPATTTKKQSSHKTSTTHTSTPTRTSTNTGAASTSSVTTSSKPTFASVGNCTQLAGVGEQFAKAMEAAVSGGKYNLGAVQQAWQNLANAAPSAIRSDIEAYATAFKAWASALSNAHYKLGTVPSASQIAALQAAEKSMNTAKLKDAGKSLEAWARQNCTG